LSSGAERKRRVKALFDALSRLYEEKKNEANLRPAECSEPVVYDEAIAFLIVALVCIISIPLG